MANPFPTTPTMAAAQAPLQAQHTASASDPHQSDQHGRPTQLVFNDYQSAYDYRHRIKAQPRYDPSADTTIQQVVANRGECVKDMVQAFYNITNVEDNHTAKLIRLCTKNGPGAFDAKDVEAICQIVHHKLIYQCQHGFTGDQNQDRLRDGQAATMQRIIAAIDKDGTCQQRFDEVLKTMRDWKSVCEGIIFFEENITKLVNAPATMRADKRDQRNANKRRANNTKKGKEVEEDMRKQLKDKGVDVPPIRGRKKKVGKEAAVIPPAPQRNLSLQAQAGPPPSYQDALFSQSQQDEGSSNDTMPNLIKATDTTGQAAENGPSSANDYHIRGEDSRTYEVMYAPVAQYPAFPLDKLHAATPFQGQYATSPSPYGQSLPSSLYQSLALPAGPGNSVSNQPNAPLNDGPPARSVASASSYGSAYHGHSPVPSMHGDGNQANTNMHHRNKHTSHFDIKTNDTHYHFGAPDRVPVPGSFNPLLPSPSGLNSTFLSRNSAGTTFNNAAPASNHGYGDTNSVGSMMHPPHGMAPYPGHPPPPPQPRFPAPPCTGDKRDRGMTMEDDNQHPNHRVKRNDGSYSGVEGNDGLDDEDEFEGFDGDEDGDDAAANDLQ